MAGGLNVESGFVSLNEANSIGGVRVTGGVLAFGNGGGLGTGTVTMSGGELLATANETLSNPLNLSGTLTIRQCAHFFWNFYDRRRAWNDIERRRERLWGERWRGPEYWIPGARWNDPLAYQ